MRDAVTWIMLLVACAVVGILGYRYYNAIQQIALLTEKTARLTAELEGATEVHKLAEAKSETQLQKTVKSRDKLQAEAEALQKELDTTKKDRDGLKKQVATLQSDTKKLESSVRALQQDNEELKKQILAVTTEREKREKELADVTQKLQGLTKARQADQEALRTWQGTAQRLVEEQKKLQAELRDREEELKQSSLLEAERAAEVHRLTAALEERERRITALRKQLQEGR